MIRVLVLDDHDIARFSLCKTLASEPDIEIAGDTRSISEALNLLESTRPHAAVADVFRADGQGISAARQLRSATPASRLILLTGDHGAACMMLAGADGFVARQQTAASQPRPVTFGHHAELCRCALRRCPMVSTASGRVPSPTLTRGLITPGKDVARRWKATPMSARREIARILLSPNLLGELCVVRAAGSGQRQPAPERVELRRSTSSVVFTHSTDTRVEDGE